MSSRFVRIALSNPSLPPVIVRCEDEHQAERYVDDLLNVYTGPVDIDDAWVSKFTHYSDAECMDIYSYAPGFMQRESNRVNGAYKWCADFQTEYIEIVGSVLQVRKIAFIKDLRQACPGFGLLFYKTMVEGYIGDLQENFMTWSQENTLRFKSYIRDQY